MRPSTLASMVVLALGLSAFGVSVAACREETCAETGTCAAPSVQDAGKVAEGEGARPGVQPPAGCDPAADSKDGKRSKAEKFAFS